jgi:integrase
MADEVDGTIEERDGRFRARLPRSVDPKRRSRTFDTRDEARRFLRGAAALLVDEVLPVDGAPAPTLGSHGPGFLNRREIAGVRGIVQERSVWANHVANDPVARIPLVALDRAAMRAWLQRLRRKKKLERTAWKKGTAGHRTGTEFVSRQVMVHARRLVRRCLDDARDEGALDAKLADPLAKVRVPAALAVRTTDPWTFLELEEIERVRTHPKVPAWFKHLFDVGHQTGLRVGELWGLHWCDVRLEGDRPELVVRFSHKGEPKNSRTRVVPLPPRAAAALRVWKTECPKTVAGLVFPTVRGHRRPKSNDAGWNDRVRAKGTVRPGWKTIAGITRPVRWYDATRHTCASHLVMGSWGAQWTLQEVCAFLGHSDIEVTQRYAHLSPDYLHRKVAATIVPGPKLVPSSNGANRSAAEIPGRAMLDSNQRPLAPEAHTEPRNGAGLEGLWDQPGTSAADLAIALLRSAALEPGTVDLEAGETLARAALSMPLFRAASVALEPGPHQRRRILELAALVARMATGSVLKGKPHHGS